MDRRKLDAVKGTIFNIESALELILLTVVYYLVWKHYYHSYYEIGNGKYILLGVYAALVLLIFDNLDGFQFGKLRRLELALSQWIALGIVNVVTYLQLCLIENRITSVLPMLVVMGVDLVISAVCIFAFTAVYHKIYAPHNMIMVYGTENAVGLMFKMDSWRDKYKVKKVISVDVGLDAICEEIKNYDSVILNDLHGKMRSDLMKFCYSNQIRVYIAPKITDIMLRGAKSISTFDTPLLLIRGAGLTAGQRFIKRLFDIALCLVAMIFALPIMLIVAIAIKIEDGGPVFYTQKRATIGGKEFDILKFRSMIVDAEKAGLSIPATGNDPRITKVGRVIRATRIDELPQILNILKGDMSVVGPRPERLEHVKEYSKEIPEFEYRLKVKGGLTGYAQIYGKYNTSAYDKLRLDMLYIENYSLALDIKLILMTLRIMLQKESTEGFEKTEELERRKQEFLKEIKENDGEAEVPENIEQ